MCILMGSVTLGNIQQSKQLSSQVILLRISICGASRWVTSSRAKGGAHAQNSRVPADLGSRAGSLCALRIPEPDAPHGHPRSACLVRLAGLRRVLHLSRATGATDGTQGVQT